MTFTYPLGLLGLIGIPILIALYIIKSHYTEQTVASVYLWQLSERFLKKKKRVRLSGLLSLILQILAVAAISLTIAGPRFILRDAANDYCFVLDASASMTASCGETTRFETAKQHIRRIIDESADGSSYTLVYAGSTTYEAFRSVDDRQTALSVLDALECEQTASNCASALSVAQSYYTSEHSPLTYLLTDENGETENITLINVALSEENYAFVSYEYSRGSKQTIVSGEVISCDRDADIVLELYLNGVKTYEQTVPVTMQTPAGFGFAVDAVDFDSLILRIANVDEQMLDNEAVLYSSGRVQNNRTLLVSDAPAYLEFALKASGKTAVEVVPTKEYNEAPSRYEGYGLYIFDTGAAPEQVPRNASVWFFNAQSNVKNSGFSFREVREAEGMISVGGADADTELENRFEPEYTDATSSTVKTYLKDMLRRNISVKKYARYSASGRGFTNLLYQDNGSSKDSLLFVGNNDNGCRQVVFAFDLHDSDLPLKSDFLILLSNLLDYSYPAVIEQTLYTAGDEMVVNVPAGCTDLLLQTPAGKISYPDFSTSYAYCKLDQVGTYKITASVNGAEQEYYVYAQLPAAESYEQQSVSAVMQKQSDSTSSDGYYDKLIVYFIILALAFLLDWGVYCYEQYQLR